jgi:antitoxin VapB
MSIIKRMTEQELLEGLDARGAHADELAEPLAQELEPLERLQGSVKRYIRPTDPVWDEYFDSDEGVTDDFMEDRDQLSPTPDKE